MRILVVGGVRSASGYGRVVREVGRALAGLGEIVFVQVGQDESREGAGSEGSRILSNEGSADSEHEVDEEGSSDVEEDAVWKVRTRRTSGCLFSCAPTGYASHHATRTRR